MILSCNSCEKKFVVPDDAISATGRLVQCSSCGNKWKQLPIETKVEIKDTANILSKAPKKIINIQKIKKKAGKKKSGPNLYSPEYLAKKHGIRLDENITDKKINFEKKGNINFGFYNSLIILLIFIIFTLRILYFTQDIIAQYLPESKMYIDYLFENIKNIKEIIQNFFLGY